MNKDQQTILGLFSSLRVQRTGGIERSGRIAWQGIVEQIGKDRVRLCCYDALNAASEKTRGMEAEKSVCEGEMASSKIGAILMACRQRSRVDTILVWHLHLLRLLPFLRFSAARVVVFLHGIEAWKRPDWLTRLLLRRVHLFLSNSRYTWEQFVHFHPHLRESAHRVVSLGIEESLTGPTPLSSQQPAVLMLGRLARSEDYKGHREMIAAWPLVRECFPQAELWIAGDGDLRPELEALSRARGLAQSIRFMGYLSEEEKQQALVRCSCLALPSRGEGFGLVYLEAMRLGRPCLVSTLDAGREVVNPPEAGLSADPRDTQTLAEAVCRLLTPGQEWENWAMRARQRYDHHFTAGHFQRRLLEALACV